MSWPQVELGEIFDIARGGSPRPIDDYITDSPNGINWVSIKDASNSSKYITTTAKKIDPSGVSKSREVKPGDFLLSNSMSFGRPYIMRTNGCIHDGWLVLSGSDEVVDQDYFYHLLGSDTIYRKFSSLAAGAVVKNLNTGLVKKVRVPLPPLPEQRRIAAILDKADALRQKRREAIAKLDQLLQSVFLEMFGDPVTNPKGWPIHSLPDVTFFQEGPGILAKDFRERGVPLVRLAGVKESDRVTLAGCNYVDPKMVDKRWNHFRLARGDILILTSASIGHSAVVDVEAEGAIPYTGIIRFRSTSSELISEFLMAFLTSPWFSHQTQAMASGAVIKHFGPTHLKKMNVPMPPLSVQERYADWSAKIGINRSLLVQAETKNDVLFQSLQHKAFTGQL